MTPQIRLFIEFYLGEAALNGARAARMAGYSAKTAKEQATRLLQRKDVRAAVKKRMEEAAMSTDEILFRLGQHARATMEPFIYGQATDEAEDEDLLPSGKVDLQTKAARDHAHLVKETTQIIVDFEGGRRTTNKVKLHDAQTALLALARIAGLFKPDPSESLLGTVDITKLNDEQLGRLAAGEPLLQVLLAVPEHDASDTLPTTAPQALPAAPTKEGNE